ncbi:hypothetical protein R3P38DRAFT_3283482 [Favolaschia claudopus]|uniref:Uncharacterized protein n=1 Tax=Favolaschia claudopus TaxID=2862362 RepID=A0AAW0A7A3_9AGAR
MTSYASHIPHVPLSQPMAPRPTNYPAPSRTLWDLTAQPLPKPSHSRLKQSRVHVHIPVHEFPSDDQTYEYLHLRGSNLPAKNVDFGFLRFPLRLMLKTSEFLRFRGSSIQADVHDSRIPAYLISADVHEVQHSSWRSRFPNSCTPVGPALTLMFTIHEFPHPYRSSLSRLPNSCVVVGPAFKLMFKTSELLRYRWSSVQAIVPNSPIPAFPWFQRQR